MRSLGELVLVEGREVSAVGWIDETADDQVLCVSPSWRDDRRVRVKNGYVRVSSPAAEADALLSDRRHGFVRVKGIWQDGSLTEARVVERLETNQPATMQSSTEVVISPAPEEQRSLSALLKTGTIAWYRAVRLVDGGRVLRVGAPDLEAAQAALGGHGLTDVELIEVAWTSEDVETARTQLNSQSERWHVAATGGGGVATAAELPGFSAEVLYVEADFATWAGALPPGMLAATVLIKPAD
jgi:hypothetical protein